MPSSNYEAIPWVLDAIRELNPQSILDVGTGAGKYGVLFREYLDICISGINKNKRSHIIDGMEVFDKNINPIHHEVYDKIYLGDIRSLIGELPNYDVIFLGDIIEHFKFVEGVELLKHLVKLANVAVIVVTPLFFSAQGSHDGNICEEHLSHWRKFNFRELSNCHCVVVAGQLVVAMFKKNKHIKSWRISNRTSRWTKMFIKRIFMNLKFSD